MRLDSSNSKQLHFAPMEGVTDQVYRQTIQKLFPEWDRFSTDFLRVPTTSKFKEKHLVDHFGKDVFQSKALKEKTTFQILTTTRANTQYTVSQINGLGIGHLDLNLGCPSKKVNSHGGGAILLKDLQQLSPIIKTIRDSFNGFFTVKIRIGYNDDQFFLDSLKLFENEGVDGIILHARTREQLYKGKANWDYIKTAAAESSIPVVGNGDVWQIDDINKMYQETNCHSIMCGRGALKTPWLATVYKEFLSGASYINEEFLLTERKHYIEEYFEELMAGYKNIGRDNFFILNKFKSLSRYMFDDYQNSEEIKSGLLRSKNLEEFLSLFRNTIL